jgi:hypothetical protein
MMIALRSASDRNAVRSSLFNHLSPACSDLVLAPQTREFRCSHPGQTRGILCIVTSFGAIDPTKECPRGLSSRFRSILSDPSTLPAPTKVLNRQRRAR